MRVGIDAHFVTRSPRRGIGTYSLNLIREIVTGYPDIEFYLYIRHPDSASVLPMTSNVCVRQLAAPVDPLWEQIVLPLAARRDNIDILHSLGNTGPLFFSSQTRHVLSLMDVMFLQSGVFFPKPTTLYQRIGRWYRSIVSPRCSRNATAVITISEFSKYDIKQFIPGLDPGRLTVTHLACDPSFTELSLAPTTTSRSPPSLGTEVPFILCLGADDPRKNTLRLVRAYLKLVRDNGIAENLVIAGYRNWEDSLSYKEVIKASATDRVKFLPFVSMPDLVSLYRHATLFAYPSLYEGFGIPILEAFNTGCPVVASGTTSIPEVGGDAVLYIDPESSDELAAAMLRLILDQTLRESLISLGRARAAQFGWDRVASQTIEVYRRCFAGN